MELIVQCTFELLQCFPIKCLLSTAASNLTFSCLGSGVPTWVLITTGQMNKESLKRLRWSTCKDEYWSSGVLFLPSV